MRMIGLGWIDLVQADLEGAGYTSGALDLCAAGFYAPHIRQRLFWVADADYKGSQGRDGMPERANQCVTGSNGMGSRVADASSERIDRDSGEFDGAGSQEWEITGWGSTTRRVANPDMPGQHKRTSSGEQPLRFVSGSVGQSCGIPSCNFWHDSDWLLCRDPKGPRWRPVEPGTFPLANGVTGRMGRLRAYGNAINAEVTKAFVELTI